jgi:dipeptidyl aminopeptidase/acylaminoacyl peptidase
MMRSVSLSRRLVHLASPLVVLAPALLAQTAAQTKPTIAQFLSPASPLEVTSARKADRIAWMTYERGMRNVYTAAAPDFRPVRLTRFLDDDGRDLTDVNLSNDGSVAVFVRGSAPNRQGWIANPSHDPNGAEREIWAVRTAGGAPWRVAEGAAPEVSPDGRYVLYVKDGQIYRGRITPPATPDSMDRGQKPFIKEWGRQSNPKWSPDGSKIAYVTDRQNHSFIAVYDGKTRTVTYLAPSVDFDAAPVWSPDGKHVAFTRRPGTPFGQQAQTGEGGIGNPAGPASGAASRSVCPPGLGNPFGRGGGGGRAGPDTVPARQLIPGLCRATFAGGYTLSVMIADVGTRTARELWHNAPNDSTFPFVARLMWAGDRILLPVSPLNDEWERYYSLDANAPTGKPVLLTTTNGLIEDATSASVSDDGKTLYYCTNAEDIERRHIWAVPTSGGTPKRISTGDGIETYPQPLPSGKQVAVLYFDASTPASVGLVPVDGGKARVIFPTLGADFPKAQHVTPEIVVVKSPDGLEIHNQVFLPKDLKAGERRPALIFVHGGPPRQMMPGYHYMQFYHWAYAINQWLANQGYVVMSVNYRSGIGYGRSFRQAPNTNARGNSEYQDVLAAGKYLQTRADVDPARIGIWGLSYGGLLTSQALARNSDLFVAGADLAGVHLYGSSLDTTSLSYKSSAISSIDNWKSPVFLVHGDDDRNVDFAQTVGLVQLLRARGVYYELKVIPDDLHESMLHSRWIDTFTHMGDFLHRFVWNKESAAANEGSKEK